VVAVIAGGDTMTFARRRFLHLAASAAALPAVSRMAKAQAYPTRPITMIVAGYAGGSVDAAGRVLAERMRASLKQPIIIENVTERTEALGPAGSLGHGLMVIRLNSVTLVTMC
jgi:tripartite-type tricarboxylate transporter receptor subunit TctC